MVKRREHIDKQIRYAVAYGAHERDLATKLGIGIRRIKHTRKKLKGRMVYWGSRHSKPIRHTSNPQSWPKIRFSAKQLVELGDAAIRISEDMRRFAGAAGPGKTQMFADEMNMEFSTMSKAQWEFLNSKYPEPKLSMNPMWSNSYGVKTIPLKMAPLIINGVDP
jgi:hypothetical protein